ncbi:hypothetical protein ES703_68707 [subsurface metagenome]
MSELITQAEFARRVGVSAVMVHKAIGSGRITKTSSGKIDWASQSIVWEANRSVHKDHRSRGIDQDGNIHEKYKQVLTTFKYYDAKIRELKYKELEGELISKENNQKRLGPKLTLIKNHIMTLSARHAHTTAAILIRHVKKKSKNVKYIAGLLKTIDPQQLSSDICESMDSDLRTFLKEVASAEHY